MKKYRRQKPCTTSIKIFIALLAAPAVVATRGVSSAKDMCKNPKELLANVLNSGLKEPESLLGKLFWWWPLQVAIRMRETGSFLLAPMKEKEVQDVLDVTSETSVFRIKAPLSFQPLVSVLVPNYNQGQYLNTRLESIFSQSYTNFEVIVLDNASTDGSLAILDQWRLRYPHKMHLYANEKHSEGTLHQWKKGIELAKGELVWIAESSSTCSTNLLATLVPFFYNEGVMLAHCQARSMDLLNAIHTKNSKPENPMEMQWEDTCIYSADYYMNHYLAIKNTILSISSAVFRKRDMGLLNDQKWLNMHFLGDWLFFIHAIRAGLVAYSNKATAYYQIAAPSASQVLPKSDDYQREHNFVACEEVMNYAIERSTLENMVAYSQTLFTPRNSQESQLPQNSLLSLDSIVSCQEHRKLNILMCGDALTAGGGEHFPIFLANALARAGHAVTFVDFTPQVRNPLVRSKLSSNVPLMDTEQCDLATILEFFKPDIVHSHNARVDFTIAQAASPTKYAHVVSLHGCYESIPNNMLEGMLPVTSKSVTRWLYTADKNLNAFKQKGVDIQPKACKLYNAVETESIVVPERSLYGIPAEAFVLCLISRAVAEKGWQEAVEIVCQAQQQSARPIHLVLIGEGPMYDKLLGHIPEFVHLLGFQKNVTNFFAMCDLGFLPSRFMGESLPLVNLHCFAAGKPVLASNVGDIAQQIEPIAGKPAGVTFDLDKGNIPIAHVAKLIVELANDQDCYAKLLYNVPATAALYDINTLAEKYVEQYKIAIASRTAV